MAEEIVLGGYKRINVLQTGQNSEVWEVSELGSHRRFAMKLLLPERADDPAHQRALKYEANVGIKLQHPNIIRTYSFSKDRDVAFILMEYFPSVNLKLRIMRGQSEFLRPNLRKIINQSCQAMMHVHENGYVHRDVKPDNILANGTGEVRLIDFALAVKMTTGLAKMFARRSRTTAGTRSYMSPEQIRCLPLDGRADVYSLGVVLYELVSGRVPFTGLSGGDLLRKHLDAAVPAFEPQLNLTPEFVDLVNKMLAKKKEDRPGSMLEVQSALKSIKIYNDEEEEVPGN